MIDLHWTWLVVLVDIALLVAGVAAVGYVLRSRAEDPSAARDWGAGAGELTREVRGVVAAVERPANPDPVARRLLSLSGRIRSHVRGAPATVEEAAYRGLYELGVACQNVALEHRSREAALGGVLLEEHLDALAETAAALEAEVTEGR